MHKSAYWLGNMIVDLLKLELLVIASCGFFWVFNLIGNNSIPLYLVFPFAIVPFTYVTSFMFKSDNMAQTVTMFVHFFIIAVSGTTVYFIRATPASEFGGDIINFVMKAVPSYPLSNGVYCDSQCYNLDVLRDNTDFGNGMEISPDPMHISNIPLDLIAMAAHFIFWLLVLILIELNVCKCRGLTPKKRDLEPRSLDSDVIEESHDCVKRVDSPIQLVDFQKIYRTYARNPCKPQDCVAVESLSFAL